MIAFLVRHIVLLACVHMLGCVVRQGRLSPVNGLTMAELCHRAGTVVIATGEQEVRIASDERVVVEIEITTKGNGTLTLLQRERPVLAIRIYDDHQEADNWDAYEGGLLSYRFEDTDSDGILELVTNGRIQRFQGDTLVRSELVKDVYKYSPADRSWSCVSSLQRRRRE